MKNKPSSSNVKKAYVAAAIADAIQLPLYAALLTGIFAVPSEFIDTTVDIAVMVLLCRWVGFHWCLLPCLFLEFVPGLEMLPTWTAAVAFILSQRNKSQSPPPIVTVVDAEVIQPTPPLLARHSAQDVGQNN